MQFPEFCSSIVSLSQVDRSHCRDNLPRGELSGRLDQAEEPYRKVLLKVECRIHIVKSPDFPTVNVVIDSGRRGESPASSGDEVTSLCMHDTIGVMKCGLQFPYKLDAFQRGKKQSRQLIVTDG